VLNFTFDVTDIFAVLIKGFIKTHASQHSLRPSKASSATVLRVVPELSFLVRDRVVEKLVL